jgi:hypothetical protein
MFMAGLIAACTVLAALALALPFAVEHGQQHGLVKKGQD